MSDDAKTRAGLHDLADAKGSDVVKSTMKDHVRLIGPDKSVKKDKGGAAFSYAGAAAISGRTASSERKIAALLTSIL